MASVLLMKERLRGRIITEESVILIPSMGIKACGADEFFLSKRD